MGDAILLTGGTGTLGREVLPMLLQEHRDVFVLTRSPDAARESMRQATSSASHLRLHFVRGDVTVADHLGLATADAALLREQVSHVLHCAAATTFTLPLAEARTINVDGTAALLSFARTCRRLEGIACASTAYVAGTRTGVIREEGGAAASWINTYEQSKFEMEALARHAMGDLPIALLRYSTVIGRSDTGAVTTFNAIHHALRLLYHGLAPMLPGTLTTPVDLIPLDFAVAATHHIARRPVAGATYHICSGANASCSVNELLDETMRAFLETRPAWRKRRVARPAVVDAETYALFTRSVAESGNVVLQAATTAVESFAAQLLYPKTFDTTAATAVLAGSGIGAPPVLQYFGRVVRYCVESNWGRQAPDGAAA